MDITQLILDDHAEQRRLFSLIEQIGADNVEALEAVWGRLSAFLDAHAEAEERHFYPALLKLGEGVNDADDGTVEGETEDAIEDHNKLRDAVKAVAAHAVGSRAWFDAVGAANIVNSKHMGEEELRGPPHRRGEAGQQRPRNLRREPWLTPPGWRPSSCPSPAP